MPETQKMFSVQLWKFAEQIQLQDSSVMVVATRVSVMLGPIPFALSLMITFLSFLNVKGMT